MPSGTVTSSIKVESVQPGSDCVGATEASGVNPVAGVLKAKGVPTPGVIAVDVTPMDEKVGIVLNVAVARGVNVVGDVGGIAAAVWVCC